MHKLGHCSSCSVLLGIVSHVLWQCQYWWNYRKCSRGVLHFTCWVQLVGDVGGRIGLPWWPVSSSIDRGCWWRVGDRFVPRGRLWFVRACGRKSSGETTRGSCCSPHIWQFFGGSHRRHWVLSPIWVGDTWCRGVRHSFEWLRTMRATYSESTEKRTYRHSASMQILSWGRHLQGVWSIL